MHDEPDRHAIHHRQRRRTRDRVLQNRSSARSKAPRATPNPADASATRRSKSTVRGSCCRTNIRRSTCLSPESLGGTPMTLHVTRRGRGRGRGARCGGRSDRTTRGAGTALRRTLRHDQRSVRSSLDDRDADRRGVERRTAATRRRRIQDHLTGAWFGLITVGAADVEAPCIETVEIQNVAVRAQRRRLDESVSGCDTFRAGRTPGPRRSASPDRSQSCARVDRDA